MYKRQLISCAAGVIGTGTGGVIGLLLGESSKRSMSYLLSFCLLYTSMACLLGLRGVSSPQRVSPGKPNPSGR